MNFVKLLVTCIIFINSTKYINAANDSLDLLLKKLTNSKNLKKTLVLNQLAKYYQDSSFSKTTYYAELAIQNAKIGGDSTEMADAYFCLGNVNLLKGENSIAHKQLKLAYKLYSKSNNRIGIARCSDNLGSIFRYMGSNEKSLKFHLEALAIFTELRDTSGLISVKNNLGILYRTLENKQKSLTFYKEALNLAQKTNSKLLSTVLNSIGSYYWYQKSFDSSLYYYQHALMVKPTSLLLKERHCAALNNIGNIYRSKENLDSSIIYYTESLKKSNQYELFNLSSITLKNFGIVYTKLGKYDEALNSIDKSIQLAKKSNLKRTICDDYLLLSEIYSKQGDYKKAFDRFKDYSTIRDSIFNDEQANKITQLEVDYVVKQKAIDNAILLKNNAEQKLVIQRRNSLLIISVLIISFLIVITIIGYKHFISTKRSAKKLSELNENLEKRVLSRTQNLRTEIEEHKITAWALTKAKEKAEESDKLKSSFLANLSHEIRTPMNAILGFSNLLSDENIAKDKKQHFITIIQKSGNKLLLIINDIIEISKIEAGQITPNYTHLNINEFVIELFDSMKVTIPYDKAIDFTVTNSKNDRELIVLTDEIKLHQIMVNLLNNAIKFTEKGEISFGYEVVNNAIRFTVRDTGTGIDDKHKQIVFERFRQVEGDLAIKNGGSGLGLAISKAYVEMLGGTIHLESELGKGSTFWFTIPFVEVEKNEMITPEILENTYSNQSNDLILIAEDDDTNFFYFKELMADNNIKYIRALNGKEALDICTKKEIRLVLMDIKMPIMDGYEAIKRIRALKPNQIIVAQTAYALPEDVVNLKKAGFNDYITKPISKVKLYQVIESFIGK